MSVAVDSYMPLFFNLVIEVLIDSSTYQTPDVQAAIEVALIDAFSFDSRSFAQPVAAAEITAIVSRFPASSPATLQPLYQYQNGQAPRRPTAAR